jgi:hypothetical protein
MSTNIKDFNYVTNEFNFSKNINKTDDEIYKYFYKLPIPLEELFGKDIITLYYSTKYLFKKLKKIYVMMLNLIEINEEILNKVISRNNYVFNESNFIFFNSLTENDEDDFNNLFNLSMQSIPSKIVSKINDDKKDYITKFLEIDGVINCLSNTKKPFFLNLFDQNYNGKYKVFFMNLFEEYNKTRQQILDIFDLRKNSGILSLKPIIEYDIKENINNVNIKNNSDNENNFSNMTFFNSDNNLYKGIKSNNENYDNSTKNKKKIEKNILEKELILTKAQLNKIKAEKKDIEQKMKNILSGPQSTDEKTVQKVQNEINTINRKKKTIQDKLNKNKKNIKILYYNTAININRKKST